MEDGELLKHIKKLAEQEGKLYESPDLTQKDVQRLHEIKIELDQCWDFLRQRRALRNAGENPEQAQVRDADVVENYED